MNQYHALVRHILNEGQDRGDRTGTGTRSVFGHQMRFDLSEGFPLVTTKKTHMRSIIHELLWFLKGDTNIRYLQENGVTIWDKWADQEGNLGPVYGYQWRSWPNGTDFDDEWREVESGIDQISKVVDQIRTNPNSRRLIVTAWNPAQVDEMALPPCHCLFQFYVDQDAEGNQRLSCQLYQRSADVFLGVPFNIASYALLVHLIAHQVGMVPGNFVHTLGDAHVYHNHFDQCIDMLDRRPLPLSQVTLHHEPGRPLDQVRYEDIELLDYSHYPAIKAPVAV